MKILTDLHHHALAESLLMLFEDRQILGPTEVFFPAGMDWFDKDVWQFEKAWHGDKVAKQYLTGIWPDQDFSQPTVTRYDRKSGRHQRGVTLDAALSTDWDFILCSLPHNYDGFYKLAQETGAKYGIQIGNNVQQWDERADFALSSSTLPTFGPEFSGQQFRYFDVPTVMYHQEFSTELFRFEWPPSGKYVASFVNCFPEGPSYPAFLELARATPEFDWRVYGALGTGIADEFQAGDVETTADIAEIMRNTRIGLHQKHWSDGYGHTIHNWGAVGRPVIGIPRYYADKLAGPLFVDGVTSFDIETRSTDELVAIMRRLRDDDEYHHRISSNMAARFKEVVNFDQDASAVKALLESVI